ncbi:MAG: SlyX family protein [Pirellula sp.]
MTSDPASLNRTRSAEWSPLDKRVQELEFIVAHLQNTVDDLNQAILLQQKKIELLARQIDQAKSFVESAMSSDNSTRSLADDKPPHY